MVENRVRFNVDVVVGDQVCHLLDVLVEEMVCDIVGRISEATVGIKGSMLFGDIDGDIAGKSEE